MSPSRGWIERERTLQPDGEPGTELIVHLARGLLRLSQGRLEEALAALRAAERMQAMLAGTHVFSAAVQARLLQTQVYMGRLAAARATLAEISEQTATPAICAWPPPLFTSPKVRPATPLMCSPV